MSFIPALKRKFVLLFLVVVVFSSVFFSLTLIGQNTDQTFDSYHPQYPDRGWYIIELVNIPIGVATVSVNNAKKNLQYDYAMQFASRIGISPITSEIVVQTEKGKNSQKQISQRFVSKSQSANSKINNAVLIDDYEKFFTTKASFFFNENAPSNFNSVLSPFPKQFLKLNETFEASYGSDNFLKTAVLKINENIQIEFKRVDEKKYHEYTKKIYTQKIDLDWLNGLANNQQEIGTLINNLANCQTEMQNINKSILKQMPYESYLIYRRIINLNHFCSALQKKLVAAEDNSDEYERLNVISDNVKNLLKEDTSELPHAISQFSEKTLYYNNEVAFLWPRITSVMIQNAIAEIANLYQLDLNRKSLLNIQVKIAKMQPQAVVRADIRQISSPIKFVLQSNKDEKKQYFLTTQRFIDRIDDGLGDICTKYDGNIGLDLDTPNKTNIINAAGIRGVWDIQTKLTIARQFSIQTALEKKCQNIYFNVNSEDIKYFQQELNVFKNESLSLENSMLLSNFDHKKLWVIPGKYRITISSIINEKVISVQDFNVGDGTQTNVVANVN